MKLTIISTMLSLLVVFSASANLGRIADDISYQADDLRNVVRDYQDRMVSKREVVREVRRLKDSIRDLEDRLGSGGRPDPHTPPMSATCNLKVGGNFFTPTTHVLCTVYGNNAAGYEIRVVNSYSDDIEFQGQLNPDLSPQAFDTSKKKVGGHSSTYMVYILTREGFRVHVATLK